MTAKLPAASSKKMNKEERRVVAKDVKAARVVKTAKAARMPRVVKTAKDAKAVKVARAVKAAKIAMALRVSLRIADVNLTMTLKTISSRTDMKLEKNEIMTSINTSLPCLTDRIQTIF